ALGQGDDGALGVLALADPVPRPLALALTVDRVDRGDLDAEDLLDGDLDLRLVRGGVHDERVLALVEKVVALLGDDRGDDDVVRVPVAGGAHFCSSSTSSEPALAVAPLPVAGPAT